MSLSIVVLLLIVHCLNCLNLKSHVVPHRGIVAVVIILHYLVHLTVLTLKLLTVAVPPRLLLSGKLLLTGTQSTFLLLILKHGELLELHSLLLLLLMLDGGYLLSLG